MEEKEQIPMPEKIKGWLKKTGFPLEMETAAAFKNAGLYIEQSSLYQDPEEGKGREIDVIASSKFEASTHFIIECKNSGNPWLVLTSEDLPYRIDSIETFCISTEWTKNLIRAKTSKSQLLRFVDSIALNCKGYALQQAKWESKDANTEYAATMGVLKAALMKCRNGDKNEIAFYFPVIVVSSPIFECALSSEGEITVREVEQSKFVFSAYVPDYQTCVIRIVKASNIRNFSLRSSKLCKLIEKEFNPAANFYIDSSFVTFGDF